MDMRQWLWMWFEDDGYPRYIGMTHEEWWDRMRWSLRNDVEWTPRDSNPDLPG